MSELKARHIVDVYDDYAINPFGERSQVYLKSEADKVIADLEEKHKTEVKELLCLIRDKENNFNRAFDSVEKELRHHKYKRCLAMARWCESEAYIHEHGSEYDEKLVAWFGKWYERWLKIAEQFKEGV